MEELKMLVGMVAELPQLAIWVLVAFYAYKVIVIGSIYGLIRFVVSKSLDTWSATPKVWRVGKTDTNVLHEYRAEFDALMKRVQEGANSEFIGFNAMKKLRKALSEENLK